MSRWVKGVLVICGILGMSLWLIVPRMNSGADLPMVSTEGIHHTSQAADEGVCPWRTPDADLKQFFPTATTHEETSLVLSRFRQDIAKRLGRMPTGEENLLRLFRVKRGTTDSGVILPRRIRGESGVIELILAVDTQGKVIGAKIQRLREPDDVAKVLRSREILGAFAGKSADSPWKLGQDFAQVASSAQRSASALLEGARTALILLEAGTHNAP
jgi:hypothetical protein